MPPAVRDPAPWPARPRRAVPLAVGRVHLGPAFRSGSDLVSEIGRPGRCRADPCRRSDRSLAALGADGPRLDEPAVRARPGRGHGPRAPDALGRRSRDRPSRRDRSRRRAPSGSRSCRPSSAARRSSSSSGRIAERLGRLRAARRGRGDLRGPLDVRADQPGRPGGAARSRDRAAGPGLGRPRRTAGSSTSSPASRARTAVRAGPRLENVFGPTQCRTIRYCADCRQPFEAIKPV